MSLHLFLQTFSAHKHSEEYRLSVRNAMQSFKCHSRVKALNFVFKAVGRLMNGHYTDLETFTQYRHKKLSRDKLLFEIIKVVSDAWMWITCTLFYSILFYSILFYCFVCKTMSKLNSNVQCVVRTCSYFCYSILFCSVLFYSVLFCSVLFCSVLYCCFCMHVEPELNDLILNKTLNKITDSKLQCSVCCKQSFWH